MPERFLRAVRIVPQEMCGDTGLDVDDRDVVDHHVVQLARDAHALLDDAPPGLLFERALGAFGTLSEGCRSFLPRLAVRPSTPHGVAGSGEAQPRRHQRVELRQHD